MVEANHLLYPTKLAEPGKPVKKAVEGRESDHPDHLVVIKYVPSVGDSKRAIDEYVSDIFCGGTNTLSIYNVCEDSLLATPIIIDLAVLAELMTRITYKTDASEGAEYESMYSILSLLSIVLKAPVVKPGTAVVNGASRQRAALENFMRGVIGLQPNSEMELEKKLVW